MPTTPTLKHLPNPHHLPHKLIGPTISLTQVKLRLQFRRRMTRPHKAIWQRRKSQQDQAGKQREATMYSFRRYYLARYGSLGKSFRSESESRSGRFQRFFGLAPGA
jgi:hypothetical protein